MSGVIFKCRTDCAFHGSLQRALPGFPFYTNRDTICSLKGTVMSSRRLR
jgi:hypothetical protein